MRIYRPTENVEEVMDMHRMVRAVSSQLILVKHKRKIDLKTSNNELIIVIPIFCFSIGLVVIDPVE